MIKISPTKSWNYRPKLLNLKREFPSWSKKTTIWLNNLILLRPLTKSLVHLIFEKIKKKQLKKRN